MRRACGCRVDPIVFGHSECDLAPRWLVRAAAKEAIATEPEPPWWILR